MALIRCVECGREISDRAAACVYCGCPIDQETQLDISYNVVIKGFEEGILKYNKIFKMTQDISLVSMISFSIINDCLYSEPNKLQQTPFVAFSSLSKENAELLAGIIRKHNGEVDIISVDEPVGVNDKININEKLNKVSERKNAPITCPHCGSTAITTGQRGFSIITGFLGSNKTVNRCGKCGYSWQPK